MNDDEVERISFKHEKYRYAGGSIIPLGYSTDLTKKTVLTACGRALKALSQ